MLNNLSFKNLSPKEMISIMLGDSKVVRLGEIEFSNDYKRTYKYITTIDNFEIESDEIFIGDVILSKKLSTRNLFRISSLLRAIPVTETL